MKEYLVIGAGHQGFALAGHLALNGERVNIWNRTESHIYEIMRNHNIIVLV
jgi:glycerol-3-phosphate dehydrogenase